MKTLIFAAVSVFALTLMSFTPYQGDPVKRLRNGNYHVPPRSISKTDAMKLKDMTTRGAKETLAIHKEWDEDWFTETVYKKLKALREGGQVSARERKLKSDVDRIMNKYLKR